MDQITFLQDMAVVMAVSAAIIIVCQRFHLPVVLGYILAGVVIGPHTPPYSLIQDLHSIHILSELGIIFLLFSIGLEFSLGKLGRVGLVAFIAATVEILLMLWIGFSIGQSFGWKFMDSLFLGAILSISSTTIIAKVLMDMKKINEQFAQVILGILIIEDLLAIVIIAALSGIAASGSVEMVVVGSALLRVVLFISGVLLFGFLLVPRLLRYVSRFENDETMIITVLGLCLGVSLLALKFGFSVALGAFLIGAIIAETKEVKGIIHKIEPIRNMFTAIFFVSVGLLLSPQTVHEYWALILILTLVTIVGKILSCSAATFLIGYSPETSLKVGLGLAQIGEFSFIIARLGESTGVTSAFLYPIAVSVSGITALTTPLLMRSTTPIIRSVSWMIPRPLSTVLHLYTGWVSNFTKSSRIEDVSQVFKRTVWFLMTVVSGLAVYVLCSPFVPRIPLAVAVAGFMAVAGFYLWKSIGKVHQRIEEIAKVIFDQDKPSVEQAGAHKEMIRLISEEYPWAVKTEDFLLPFNECGVNQTIRDLRLRSESGATIVSIYRNNDSIPNPPPETRLLPGDVLLLMGDEEQLKLALRYLFKKVKEPAPAPLSSDTSAKTQSFEVGSSCPVLGKTIREIRLRRKTGATLLGIQKETGSSNNPDPDTVLEEKDVLILFGLPEQLDAAMKYLSNVP